LRFIRDVTIPDNTEMTPAQVFTKTWLVENSGTCPWKPGFQVILIGGLALGGSPFKVSQTVGPGGSIQVSIKMVAPTNASGVVQGTWKMADETGAAFGDYLSAVIVVQAPTLRAAPSPTVASTPTP
jgi:next-to-BRCA1 protein 1